MVRGRIEIEIDASSPLKRNLGADSASPRVLGSAVEWSDLQPPPPSPVHRIPSHATNSLALRTSTVEIRFKKQLAGKSRLKRNKFVSDDTTEKTPMDP